MRAVLIRNPIAGDPSRQHALELAIDTFASANWRLDIRQTQHKEHARVLAEIAAKQGYSNIIVAGGDGSIGQVAHGIVLSGREDVRMGIIPLGTGNVFARDMGLPYPTSSKDPATMRAAQIILNEEPTPIDVGMANGNAFMCWAGCGIDATVSEMVEKEFAFNKRSSPLRTYGRQLLQALRTYEPPYMQITVDGQEKHEGRYYLAVASNIALYARYLRLTPRAYLNDGYLDLLILDAEQIIRFAYLALKTVVYPPARDRRILRHRFRKMMVECETPFPYHLDGDPLGVAPCQIEVIPQCLPVFLNPQKAQKRLV
ncbi:MAG: diacylglycerol kinase family lipid kinase [Chloroflexi bacterium]|nr:diacylglycerol kinase family lipid kinase [Chloroflexota bacterium]